MKTIPVTIPVNYVVGVQAQRMGSAPHEINIRQILSNDISVSDFIRQAENGNVHGDIFVYETDENNIVSNVCYLRDYLIVNQVLLDQGRLSIVMSENTNSRYTAYNIEKIRTIKTSTLEEALGRSWNVVLTTFTIPLLQEA